MPSMDGTYGPHAADDPQVEAPCADARAAARVVAAPGLMFRTCDHYRACPGSLAESPTAAQCPRTSSASAVAHAHGTGWDRSVPANGARALRVLGEAEHAVARRRVSLTQWEGLLSSGWLRTHQELFVGVEGHFLLDRLNNSSKVGCAGSHRSSGR